MMLAPSGEKLSKRHGAVSVERVSQARATPRMRVLNYLARFGWSYGDEEVFSRADLIEKFDLEACRQSRRKVRRQEVRRRRLRASEAPRSHPRAAVREDGSPVPQRDRH